MSDKIYILDEIVVAESQLPALRQAYLERYAPAARGRGMLLEGAWRSPPVAIDGRQATLHFLWSVADISAWWGMRLGTARANAKLDVGIEGDTDKASWWRYVDAMAVSRKRTFMVDA